MNNLYKIKDKRGQLVTFKPNYVQLKHLVERGAHGRNLMLKARQFGFTTLYCIDNLDEALWANQSGAIIADERQNAVNIFDIVKRAYVNLPDAIKPKTKTDTKHMYQFIQRYDGAPLDSMIYVALRIRSGTVQNLHVTESAYIKDRTELNAGSKQAVPITGRISEETTGNGYEDFYDTYMEAKQKGVTNPLDYKTYFYGWHENPEYALLGEPLTDKSAQEIEIQERFRLSDAQLAWRRWKMSELKKKNIGYGLTGEQLFKQEYPMTISEAFQSGAGSVFDNERIDKIITPDPLTDEQVLAHYDLPDGAVPEPEHLDMMARAKRLLGFKVKFWEMPTPDGEYVVGCDPSDGDGADDGAIDVWDKNTLRQVAQFVGKVRPDELAEILADIGWVYNEAYIGVENNMLTTVLFLSKIYSRYYFESTVDEKTQRKTKKLGWNTNSRTRDLMIDDYLILFDEGHLTIRSILTLSQMRTFVKTTSGKREHASNKHDDVLFAGFVAIQMHRAYKGKARAFAKKPF